MPSVVSPGDVTATKDLTGESAPDDSVDAAADYFAKYGGVSSEADTASSAKDSSFLGRSGSGSGRSCASRATGAGGTRAGAGRLLLGASLPALSKFWLLVTHGVS